MASGNGGCRTRGESLRSCPAGAVKTREPGLRILAAQSDLGATRRQDGQDSDTQRALTASACDEAASEQCEENAGVAGWKARSGWKRPPGFFAFQNSRLTCPFCKRRPPIVSDVPSCRCEAER